MDDRQAYCETLEERLQIIEGQLDAMKAKMPQATAAEKDMIAGVLARWPEASLLARRKLADVKQDGADWQKNKADIEGVWDNLKVLVDNAREAF